MRKIWTIIGLGVAVGMAAYAIWEKSSKTTNVPREENVVTEEPRHETNTSTGEKNINEERNTVADSMTVRHMEAAQIMKDAVDVICKRSEVSENETEELDRISKELDNLLNEE